MVQIDVTTTEVHVEMSQYVKRELHSLFNYLHSSFVDEELTSTISRHFTKRVACGHILTCTYWHDDSRRSLFSMLQTQGVMERVLLAFQEAIGMSSSKTAYPYSCCGPWFVLLRTPCMQLACSGTCRLQTAVNAS